MGFDDYKIVLYRNQPEGWVAEIPAIPGCHALMPNTRGSAPRVDQRVPNDFGGVPGKEPASPGRYHRDRSCLAPCERISSGPRVSLGFEKRGKLEAMNDGFIRMGVAPRFRFMAVTRSALHSSIAS